jgi:UDPglucose 6-dehydrogenase
LLAEGARVRAYDPVAMDVARGRRYENVVFCGDEYEAARGADALVVATEWNQFRGLDVERILGLLREPVIVDLRNIWEPSAMRSRGFRYSCVGR